MKPRNLKHIDISHTFNLVTRADRAKIGEDQFIKVSGVFNSLEGIVAQRDLGSQNIFSSYPSDLMGEDAKTFISGFRIYDAVDRETHFILLVKNTLNELEIWVYDSGWVEITPTFSEWQPAAGENDVFVKWLGVDSQRKAIMVYSYGGETFIPVSIAKHEERSRFGITLPAGWYAERHQLIPDFIAIGTATEPAEGDLVWSPTSHSFAFTGEEVVMVIANQGTTNQTINNFSIVKHPEGHEDSESAYNIIASPTVPITLEPGQETQVTVEFTNVTPSELLKVFLRATTSDSSTIDAVLEAFVHE